MVPSALPAARWLACVSSLACALSCVSAEDLDRDGQDAPVGSGGGGGGAASPPSNSGGAGSGGQTPADDDGSWEHPLTIDALPFSVAGDTTAAVASSADDYWPCAPGFDESGPEVVYRVTVAEVGWLWARVDTVDGVDVDVHLLNAPDPAACVTRAHIELGAPVKPGSYWLAVDTWVNEDGEALAGGYQLQGGFIGEAGDDCYQSPISCDETLPPYVNAAAVEAPGDAGCPAGMARIEDFCIDRYEAMLVEVLADDSLAPWSPYAHPTGEDIMAMSIADAVPQGFISQLQADQACWRAGKRLCQDSEWLRACQSAAGTTFPYGNLRHPGQCNDDRSCHPVVQYLETDAGWVWSELGNPCISQLPEGLALTGARAGCTSGEGTFDMMGNLHEWTADPTGTFRGGFYVDTVINGDGCLYATTAHSVHHWDYSTGFRCCASP